MYPRESFGACSLIFSGPLWGQMITKFPHLQHWILRCYCFHLLSQRVELAPHRDELAEMVRSQDGGVPGQVVKAVHDDGHHDVEHDEGAEEDEGDKVEVGPLGPTRGLHDLARGRVDGEGEVIARTTLDAGHHDVRPSLAGGAPGMKRMLTMTFCHTVQYDLRHLNSIMKACTTFLKLLCLSMAVSESRAMLPKSCMPTMA